jgi:hypothetical protein
MSHDTRLWMYREGEARLFEHPDQVPKNEDWRRFPMEMERREKNRAVGSPAASAWQQDSRLSQEEKLNRMSRQRLMQVAADCGARFEINWTKAQLQQGIIEVLHDNHT